MENSLGILIVLILIISKRYKASVNKQRKKVTLTSILLIPIILIYALYSSFAGKSINLSGFISPTFIIGFSIVLILGVLIGVIRSRFTSLQYDSSTGEVYTIPSIKDLIFLVALIVIKILLGSICGVVDHNIANLFNDFLLSLTMIYIITMRIVTLMRYLKLTLNTTRI
ncbi:MAG: hypothetical protein ACRDD2_07590 [Sarcina sp.]